MWSQKRFVPGEVKFYHHIIGCWKLSLKLALPWMTRFRTDTENKTIHQSMNNQHHFAFVVLNMNNIFFLLRIKQTVFLISVH